MPLTPNALAHVRANYRRVFQGRTTTVTLHFADGSTRLVPCIWRQQDLNDPELLPQAKPPNNPQQATADAAFEVLTEDVDIGTLQSAIAVVPQPYGNESDPGTAARYLIIAVQPKGLAFPPIRAYVMLRRC